MTAAEIMAATSCTMAAAIDAERYLQAAETRRWTVNTWLAYSVRGKAGRYMRTYRERLLNVLSLLLARGLVREFKSAKGGICYVVVDNHPTLAARS